MRKSHFVLGIGLLLGTATGCWVPRSSPLHRSRGRRPLSGDEQPQRIVDHGLDSRNPLPGNESLDVPFERRL